MALPSRRDKLRGKKLPSFRVSTTPVVASSGLLKIGVAPSSSAAAAQQGVFLPRALLHPASPLSLDTGEASRVSTTPGVASSGLLKTGVAPSSSAAAAQQGVFLPGALLHPAPPLSLDMGEASFTDYDAPKMATILKQICQDFETWAEMNHKDEKRDRAKFWSLKIPAILVTSAASLLAVLDVEIVDAIFAFIGAVCIALDLIMKPGKLKAVHWRAVHDLRRIQYEIKYAWNEWCLALGDKPSQEDLQNVTAKIIEFARHEHRRVQKYLVDAETAI